MAAPPTGLYREVSLDPSTPCAAGDLYVIAGTPVICPDTVPEDATIADMLSELGLAPETPVCAIDLMARSGMFWDTQRDIFDTVRAAHASGWFVRRAVGSSQGRGSACSLSVSSAVS